MINQGTEVGRVGQVWFPHARKAAATLRLRPMSYIENYHLLHQTETSIPRNDSSATGVFLETGLQLCRALRGPQDLPGFLPVSLRVIRMDTSRCSSSALQSKEESAYAPMCEYPAVRQPIDEFLEGFPRAGKERTSVTLSSLTPSLMG